jgi:hypothetical protein
LDVVAAAVFAILGRLWTLGAGVFVAEAVVLEEAFEACGAGDGNSEATAPTADGQLGGGMSEDVADSSVELFPTLSPLRRGDVTEDAPVVTLFLEAPSWLLLPSSTS